MFFFSLGTDLLINFTTFQGHKKWITGISWEPLHLSSPCRRFVSSSKDGDARIWDVTLRRSVICLSGHTLAVTCVKWGGDGFIYTGSQDCTIKVWETTQGKLIRELKVQLKLLLSFAIFV
ncbi:putative transcription factor WD40-like family [Helianthus annuus]|nr:putative transcription factor WD40-like family [Helianthus annuus]KAJ0633809.1 putative transcription factor WD40-like family [Helianthus annuus]